MVVQVTTTLVTLALRPFRCPPLVTAQVCAGLEGCVKYRDVISATAGDGRGEREASVCADRQVVAAVVLQHKPSARKTRDRAANRVGNCGGGAGDHHARDIGAGRSAATCHHAGLRRVGRLRRYRDVKSAAAGDGRGEREASVCADRQVVAAIVLQHKPRARKTRDRAANGVGNRGRVATLRTAASATNDE